MYLSSLHLLVLVLLQLVFVSLRESYSWVESLPDGCSHSRRVPPLLEMIWIWSVIGVDFLAIKRVLLDLICSKVTVQVLLEANVMARVHILNSATHQIMSRNGLSSIGGLLTLLIISFLLHKMLSFLVVIALRLLSLADEMSLLAIFLLLILLLIILLNVLMVLYNTAYVLVIVDIAGIVNKNIELLFIIIRVDILDSGRSWDSPLIPLG